MNKKRIHNKHKVIRIPYHLFHEAKDDKEMMHALILVMCLRSFGNGTLFNYNARTLQKFLRCHYYTAKAAVQKALELGWVRFEETKKKGTCLCVNKFDIMPNEMLVEFRCAPDKSEVGRHLYLPSKMPCYNKQQENRTTNQDLHDLVDYVKMVLFLNSTFWAEKQYEKSLVNAGIKLGGSSKSERERNRHALLCARNLNPERYQPWEINDLNRGLSLKAICNNALPTGSKTWKANELKNRMRKEGLISWTHSYTLTEAGDTGDDAPAFCLDMMCKHYDDGSCYYSHRNRGIEYANLKNGVFDEHQRVFVRQLGNIYEMLSSALIVYSDYETRTQNKINATLE